MFYRYIVRGAFLSLLLAFIPLQSSAQSLFRAYLASSGNDANPCSVAAPCRLLPKALSVVADGGEIWMLDSANYNTATVAIAKSVTILAVPGAVGSVVANGADAISINAASAKVSLRNLVVVPLAGASGSGVVVVMGDRLTVEGCVFAGLAGAAINVGANARLRVLDTIVRDNASGIIVDGGATADISGTKITGHTGHGLYVTALGGTTTAMVSDTILSQNANGAYAFSNGGNAHIFATRVTASKNSSGGIVSESAGGTSLVALGSSMVAENGTGVVQSGAGAVVRSIGDNHVSRNNVDVTGTITPLAPR